MTLTVSHESGWTLPPSRHQRSLVLTPFHTTRPKFPTNTMKTSVLLFETRKHRLTSKQSLTTTSSYRHGRSSVPSRDVDELQPLTVVGRKQNDAIYTRTSQRTFAMENSLQHHPFHTYPNSTLGYLSNDATGKYPSTSNTALSVVIGLGQKKAIE